MADIQNPRLLYLKGALFLGLGILASALLLLRHPDLKTAALLAIAVWAFARLLLRVLRRQALRRSWAKIRGTRGILAGFAASKANPRGPGPADAR